MGDTEIIIEKCKDCPFLLCDVEYGYGCNYPNADDSLYELYSKDYNNIPIKCPLRNGNITISLCKTKL